MMIGRQIRDDAQVAARGLIRREGLEPAAKLVRVSPYLLAKAAAGAKVAELSADALEMRLLLGERAA